VRFEPEHLYMNHSQINQHWEGRSKRYIHQLVNDVQVCPGHLPTRINRRPLIEEVSSGGD